MRKLRTNKIFALILCAIALAFAGAVETAAQQRSITGRLAPPVEAGGWLIVEAKDKYLLLNAEKFRNESWFREGTEVSATGEIKRDAVTIYQEGIPFEARTLRPAGNSDGFSNRLTTVTVSGNARVTAQPDTAIISLSVVTQSRSALEAQQQNAVKTTAVINALRKTVSGAAAEIKTSGYSLVPQRVYKENQPPTITGYEARNNVLVTLNDLTRVGAVIDAATTAGANNVGGISFTLREDGDARRRALTEAVREAVNKADALARALGGLVVRIVAVEEGASPQPVFYAQREAMAAQTADTPIEIGSLEINSQVRLIAEIQRSGIK